MKFKHFFWDFDGTLFDTDDRTIRAFQKSLHDHGFEYDTETLRPLVKVHLRHACSVIAPEMTKELIAGYHQHAGDEGYESMQPFPGVKELLRSICEHGGKNYLYTLRDNAAIDAVKHFGLDIYFTDYVTRNDGFPGKPAPDALLSQLEKHHLDPKECVMVGDRDLDLNAGYNAGIEGALYDPGHYYDHFGTRYRYTDLSALMFDLVFDGKATDLHVSDMLAIQAIQQTRHPEWGGLAPDKTPKSLLWLTGELGEVIDVIKKNDPARLLESSIPRTRFVEEMADVAMYFHDVLISLNVTAEEFSNTYFQKFIKNQKRNYTQEHIDRYGE